MLSVFRRPWENCRRLGRGSIATSDKENHILKVQQPIFSALSSRVAALKHSTDRVGQSPFSAHSSRARSGVERRRAAPHRPSGVTVRSFLSLRLATSSCDSGCRRRPEGPRRLRRRRRRWQSDAVFSRGSAAAAAAAAAGPRAWSSVYRATLS